jgi:hypothetical protein
MHKHNQNKSRSQQFNEGLEQSDLARLVHPKLHIDEFKSKMGDDADIIVLSFKVNGKAPATDLMNFFEKGYEFVLDADVSAGELDDGEYLVFIEIERQPEAAEQIVSLLTDVMNLTEQEIDDWKFQYRKSSNEHEITEKEIQSVIPLTPEEYDAKFAEPDKVEEPEELAPDEEQPELASDNEIEDMISAMQESARVPMKRTAPKNDWTESLRIAAGLK